MVQIRLRTTGIVLTKRAIDTALRSATNSLPYVDHRSVHSATITAHLQDLRSTLE